MIKSEHTRGVLRGCGWVALASSLLCCAPSSASDSRANAGKSRSAESPRASSRAAASLSRNENTLQACGAAKLDAGTIQATSNGWHVDAAAGFDAAASVDAQASFDASRVDAARPTRGPVPAALPAANCEVDSLSVRVATEADAGAATEFDCPEVPTAYVFEVESDGPAAHWLSAAGFDVAPLPLDTSPWRLHGAIVLGSGVAALPEYATYVEQYATDLYNFVDKANLLVQLQQDPKAEAEPPFLPSTHGALRTKNGSPGVRLKSPGRSLVASFKEEKGVLFWPDASTDIGGFSSQDGFEVLLTQAEGDKAPVLLEGAYGQGRIVLSQLPFDKANPEGEADAVLARSFFSNLLRENNKVCRRNTDALAISAGTIAGVIDPASSVLAILPDTQVYSMRYPGLFTAQTAFIAENVENLNIKYVFGLGDITNNNTELEWQHAAASMSLLNGRVPYALVPGNHDYGPSGDASTRRTRFNEYFRASDQAWHGGLGGLYAEGKLDNTYHLLTIAGRDYVALALEWGPRDEVLDWANDVMSAYPDRLGILTTHAFLNNNNRRYDHEDSEHSQDYNPHEYATPGVNDGEEMWQKLVRHHPFVLVLNGHVLGDGAGYLETKTDVGTTCHQMLVNYQMRKLGGEGYLRLLEFPKNEDTLKVWSYSPLYDDFLHDKDQEFVVSPFPG
jgi:Calcineurin-like phosphoesterase